MVQKDLMTLYQETIKDVEDKIKDPEICKYVKDKITALSMGYMNAVSGAMNSIRNQEKIEESIKKVQSDVNQIKSDIYIDMEDEQTAGDKMHDNDYEFEITCPYCEYEFVADEKSANQARIKCPKCENIIELDWKDECPDNCEECQEHCYEENDDSSSVMTEEESEEYRNEDEEDDM